MTSTLGCSYSWDHAHGPSSAGKGPGDRYWSLDQGAGPRFGENQIGNTLKVDSMALGCDLGGERDGLMLETTFLFNGSRGPQASLGGLRQKSEEY